MNFSTSITLVSFIIVTLLPISVHAFPGKVVGITDGDTVKILRTDSRIQVKIRLASIDTPEKKQAYGQQAKKFTASLIGNRMVEVKPITKDRYGVLLRISIVMVLNNSLIHKIPALLCRNMPAVKHRKS